MDTPNQSHPLGDDAPQIRKLLTSILESRTTALAQGQDAPTNAAPAEPQFSPASNVPSPSILPQVASSNPATGTESEAFLKWFGDSKVVDENGKPKTLYHGTTSKDFDQFNTGGGGDLGSHFGSIEQANEFAAGAKGRIYPAYLNLKNPLRLPDCGDWEWYNVAPELKKMGIKIPPSLAAEAKALTPNSKEYEAWSKKSLMTVIENAGYDGIVYMNEGEGVQDEDDLDFSTLSKDDLKNIGAQDSYIAFHPTQIKSAIGNQGTYNTDDPRIHMATGGEVPMVAGAEHGKDSVPVLAEPGEHVTNAEAAQKPENRALLEAMDTGQSPLPSTDLFNNSISQQAGPLVSPQQQEEGPAPPRPSFAPDIRTREPSEPTVPHMHAGVFVDAPPEAIPLAQSASPMAMPVAQHAMPMGIPVAAIAPAEDIPAAMLAPPIPVAQHAPPITRPAGLHNNSSVMADYFRAMGEEEKAKEWDKRAVADASQAAAMPVASLAPPIPAQQDEAVTDGPVPIPPAESPAATPIPEASLIPEVLPAPEDAPQQRPQPDLSSTFAAITPLLSGMGAGAGVGKPGLPNPFSWEDGKTTGVDSGVRQLHQAVYGRDLPAPVAPTPAPVSKVGGGLSSILPMAMTAASSFASPEAGSAASGIAGLLAGGSAPGSSSTAGDAPNGSGGSGASSAILPMVMAAASLAVPELAPMAGEAAAIPELAGLMGGEGAGGAGSVLGQLIPKLMSGGGSAGNPFSDIIPSMANGDSPFTSAPAWMPTENPFSWSGASGQDAAGDAGGSTDGAGGQGQKIDGLIKAIESLVELMKGQSGESQSVFSAGGGILPGMGQGAPGRGSRSTVPGTMADGVMSSWLPAVMRNSGR